MVERLRGRAGQAQLMRRHELLGVTCQRCGRLGVWKRSEQKPGLPLLIVDHEKPLALGGRDTDDNIRHLCEEPCHRIVTAEQFGQVATMAKGVDLSGRPTSPDHAWNQG